MKSVRIVRCVGIVSCVGALALGSGLASAQTPPQKQPTPPRAKPAEMPSTPKTASDQSAESSAHKAGAMADHHFAMEAGAGGVLEVELGKIASQKATNADVKAFGQKMVDDHSKVNDELKSIASGKNITLADETMVKARHKAMIDRLEKLSGAAFDKAYMDAMVKDHNTDVAAFEKEAGSGKDPELKAFASKTLPTLKEHQKLAKETHSKLTAKGTN